MEDGSGLPPLYPAISESEFLNERIADLPCLIRNGQKGKILETVNMPGVNIGPIDISNLINYMTYKWGMEGNMNIQEVERAIQSCP